MTSTLDSSLLQVSKISKTFETLMVLRDVSLGVERGKITGLIGPNGSGKSTLFDIISGFEHADEGQVVLNGRRIDGLAPHHICRYGLMRSFQLSEGGQRLTALENLLASATNQRESDLLGAVFGVVPLLRRERENLVRARRILELLRLEHVANEYVANLSGGQRKLIDLGRILMAQPALCLLDEPTAGVNPSLITVILEALRTMNAEFGITIFVVEHNMRVISDICSTVYVLDSGTIICVGTPSEVQSNERVLRSYLGPTRGLSVELGG